MLDFRTHSSDSVDYPDLAHRVAKEISTGQVERGLLVCGTGVGMAMAANRAPLVRAVNATDLFTTAMSRAHNDANLLALGARVVGLDLAKELLRTFLETPFDQSRHSRRVEKIEHPLVGRT